MEEENQKKFIDLATPGAKLLFVAHILKKEGVLTEEQHALLKNSQFQGKETSESQFLLNLLGKEKNFQQAKVYVEIYIQSLKSTAEIDEEKANEPDDMYSPATREKITDAEKGTTSSPMGDLMIHRKKKIDQAKKNQKAMGGFSMNAIEEKASP